MFFDVNESTENLFLFEFITSIVFDPIEPVDPRIEIVFFNVIKNIFKKIFHSIKSKGFLLYETFSEENIKFGPPKNTNYLLKSGELLNLANKNRMTIIEYEEIITQKKKPKAIQRIFAKIK